MLGSLLKHRTWMRSANSAQPKCAASAVTIASSVTPCRGLLRCFIGSELVVDFMSYRLLVGLVVNL